MDDKIKCFSEEHKDINAISICPECRIYMCNKCENTHSSFFKNHHSYKLNKDDEIFTGFCQEKNHTMKLEFFCKNHNQLCCGACIAKLKKNDVGQHSDCEILDLEKIKDEKKNKLKENIKCLEELETQFNEKMNNLKDIFQKIEKDKEDLKLNVQNIFTKIRNIINEREEQLLLDIDKIYNKNYFDEDIIKKGEKLPKQIKLSLAKGKLIDKEWDNNNLNTYINDCIKIENNIKDINIINKNINKFNQKNQSKINFYPKGDSFNNFLQTLSSFGKISLNDFKFRECPEKISQNRAYILSGIDKNIMTKTDNSQYNWMGTICENEFDKSIEEHKWKIKILKTGHKYIMVGVANIDFDINSSNYNTCGWYLYCFDSTLYSGPPFNYCSKNTNLSKVKDEIVIILNMKKRTLKFIINGEDKGDSYTNIPIDKPLFPAVCLDENNDSIEISNY